MILKSWISPKTQKGLPSKIHGKGWFAVRQIDKGEILAVKAGHIVNKELLKNHRGIINNAELQISDEFFIAPMSREEYMGSMTYCNHSCEPNLGFGGNILAVSMRDIAEGEEITIDYCMEFTDPSYRLVCNCQIPSCRKIITGNDWKIPELQKRYAGYFQWYIEQKIKARQGNT